MKNKMLVASLGLAAVVLIVASLLATGPHLAVRPIPEAEDMSLSEMQARQHVAARVESGEIEREKFFSNMNANERSWWEDYLNKSQSN